MKLWMSIERDNLIIKKYFNNHKFGEIFDADFSEMSDLYTYLSLNEARQNARIGSAYICVEFLEPHKLIPCAWSGNKHTQVKIRILDFQLQ